MELEQGLANIGHSPPKSGEIAVRRGVLKVGRLRTPSRYFRVSSWALCGVLGAASGLLLNTTGALADSPNQVDESQLDASSVTSGDPHHPNVGARTVDFWSGSSTANGQTFNYDIVGADPATGSASTVVVDVVLVDVKVGGVTFHASDVLDPVLASPIFQTADYSTTSMASSGTMRVGAGGDLSSGNVGVQLTDAVMRSQFNQTGTDYHLNLVPSSVHKPVLIDVPASAGVTMTSRNGHVTVAWVDQTWFLTRIEDLTASLHWLEPHRLAMFLTNDVLLTTGGAARHCCVFGDHGVTDVTAEGNGSDGRQALQTYVWSSWLTPGFFNPALPWSVKDISGLSHEVVEWANNPFLTNLTNRWMAPGYACNAMFETGDPSVGIGFSVGANTFIDPADPSASEAHPVGFGDGTYHVQDVVFLPWFIGLSPNTMSQPIQGSSDQGRYTFLGNLNRFGRLLHPATAC